MLATKSTSQYFLERPNEDFSLKLFIIFCDITYTLGIVYGKTFTNFLFKMIYC